MKCMAGVRKSLHWENRHGFVVSNHSMFHIDSCCPFKSGNCVSNCGGIICSKRECVQQHVRIIKMREDQGIPDELIRLESP